MKPSILTVGSSIKTVINSVLDLVFPNSCAMCHQLIDRQDLACEACIVRFANLTSKHLENATTTLEVFSMFSYSHMTKKLVLGKFWQDTSSLFKAGFALKHCPRLLTALQRSDVKKWIIVPVPLHWTREFFRGFNQAQILARGFSSAMNFEVIEAITRARRTEFQSKTENKIARVKNILGAFTLNTFRMIGRTENYLQQKFAGTGVILLDDLLTSGATLLECSKVIKRELKPTKIIGLTLCR